MQERVVARRFERGRPTRDRLLRNCRRLRPPRGCLAADGSRRARGAGPRRSTPAHCSRHVGSRSNQATCAARSRPGTRSEDRCSSGGLRSPRCSRSSTKSSPGAASTDLRRSRRTRFSAVRTSIRGSAASTRPGTSSSGRRRFAASSDSPTAWPRRICAGFEMEQLAGDLAAAEREAREAIRVGIEMGASRYVALYRIDLASVLLDQGREAEAIAELEQARERGGYAPLWKSNRARALARVKGRSTKLLDEARDAAAERWPGATTSRRMPRSSSTSPRSFARAAIRTGPRRRSQLAISLHEEKGNVVNAEQCRRLLADEPATGAGA